MGRDVHYRLASGQIQPLICMLSEWHRIVFGRLAEYAATFITGAHLQVIGELNTRSYTAKDGSTKFITEVRVRRLSRLDRNQNGSTKQESTA